jgi:hypothetical protein
MEVAVAGRSRRSDGAVLGEDEDDPTRRDLEDVALWAPAAGARARVIDAVRDVDLARGVNGNTGRHAGGRGGLATHALQDVDSSVSAVDKGPHAGERADDAIVHLTHLAVLHVGDVGGARGREGLIRVVVRRRRHTSPPKVPCQNAIGTDRSVAGTQRRCALKSSSLPETSLERMTGFEPATLTLAKVANLVWPVSSCNRSPGRDRPPDRKWLCGNVVEGIGVRPRAFVAVEC